MSNDMQLTIWDFGLKVISTEGNSKRAAVVSCSSKDFGRMPKQQEIFVAAVHKPRLHSVCCLHQAE